MQREPRLMCWFYDVFLLTHSDFSCDVIKTHEGNLPSCSLISSIDHVSNACTHTPKVCLCVCGVGDGGGSLYSCDWQEAFRAFSQLLSNRHRARCVCVFGLRSSPLFTCLSNSFICLRLLLPRLVLSNSVLVCLIP